MFIKEGSKLPRPLVFISFFVFIRDTKVVSSRNKKLKLKTQKGHHDKGKSLDITRRWGSTFLETTYGTQPTSGRRNKEKAAGEGIETETKKRRGHKY